MPPPKPIRLASYLQAITIAISILPLLVASGAIFWFYVPNLQNRNQTTQNSVTNALTIQIRSFFASAEREVSSLGRLIEQNKLSQANIESLLDSFASNSDFYDSIVLAGSDYTIQSVGLAQQNPLLRRNLEGLDISKRPGVRDSIATGKPSWAPSSVSAITARPTTALSVPYRDFLLLGEIAIDPIPDMAMMVANDWNVRVLIIDSDFQLVADSAPRGLINAQNMSHLALVREPQSKIVPLILDNQEWLGSSTRLENPSWTIVVALDAREPRLFVQQALLQVFTWFLLIAGFATVFASLVSRRAVKQFTNLIMISDAISSGTPLPTTSPSTIVEVQNLTLSLVSMANILTKREDELRQLNDSLEEQVVERTKALHQTQVRLAHQEKMNGLTNMVSGIAHELNTPLGNSIMAVTMMEADIDQIKKQTDAASLTKKHMQELLMRLSEASDIAKQGLDKAAKLVTGFKQIAVPQTVENKTPIVLATLAQEVVSGLVLVAQEQRVRIHLGIDRSFVVYSYSSLLAKVLFELVGNALLHAFPEGWEGERQIIITCEETKTDLVLAIQDTGVGMSPDVLAKATVPFFTTRLGKGSLGLGLSVAYNIVHGPLEGRLEIVSNKHNGTRVELYFAKDSSSYEKPQLA